MLTEERLKQIAHKLRTYAAIYTGDKEARAMADDCERAAAAGASAGAEIERIAKAMAFARIGDPNATDKDGEPRWKWYRKDAERFVSLFPARAAAGAESY